MNINELKRGKLQYKIFSSLLTKTVNESYAQFVHPEND